MSNWRLGWRFIKRIDDTPALCGRGSSAAGAARDKGDILSRERISPLNPQEKGIFIAREQLEEVRRLPIALPARGFAALALQDDLAYSYYPLPLC